MIKTKYKIFRFIENKFFSTIFGKDRNSKKGVSDLIYDELGFTVKLNVES